MLWPSRSIPRLHMLWTMPCTISGMTYAHHYHSLLQHQPPPLRPPTVLSLRALCRRRRGSPSLMPSRGLARGAGGAKEQVVQVTLGAELRALRPLLAGLRAPRSAVRELRAPKRPRCKALRFLPHQQGRHRLRATHSPHRLGQWTSRRSTLQSPTQSNTTRTYRQPCSLGW